MNSIEKEWKKILKTIIEKGDMNKKDDSMVLEILGYHTFIKNPLRESGFLSETPEDFIKYIKGGWFNIEEYPMNGQGIAEYLEGMHDDKVVRCYEKEDGFVYSYPERLLSMRIWDEESNKLKEVNQFDVIVDRLTNNSGSNRAVAHFYNCGIDRDRVDIPCLQILQATIRNNELELHVIFRSNDIYGAWVANMFFISYVGLLLCEKLNETYPNLFFKGIDYHVTSAHIYETDFGMVNKIKL